MHTSNNKGSITIFVALIIPTLIAFLFTMIDFTRFIGARNQVKMASYNAIESALGSYNSDLYSGYGLLAFKGNETIKGNIRNIVKKNLYSNDETQSSFYGFEINDSDIDVDYMGNLFQKDVLQEQMIRTMKYQAPTNAVLIGLKELIGEVAKADDKSNTLDDLEALNKEVKKFKKDMDNIEKAKDAIKELVLLMAQNYFLVDQIPFYKDNVSGIKWNDLAKDTNNFIEQCVIHFVGGYDLKDLYLPKALTAKYMKYIITAYKNLSLPEGQDKNIDLLDENLSKRLDEVFDNNIVSFKNKIESANKISDKLNAAITSITNIEAKKGSLDTKISNYRKKYLTNENLNGEDKDFYNNIKKDIDDIDSKLNNLELTSIKEVFAVGIETIATINSNVEYIRSEVTNIENSITNNMLNEIEYKALEEYIKKYKNEAKIGEEDNISKEKYINIVDEMLENLSENSTLKNSLSDQLKKLKKLVPNDLGPGSINKLVFKIDVKTSAMEGAKAIWNFFKSQKIDQESVMDILNSLPSYSIDSSIVNSMPSKNQEGLVPKEMTLTEFSEQVQKDDDTGGIFNTSKELGQDSSMFSTIASLVSDSANSLLDQLFLVEYIMTNFKGMIDENRMPAEYDGDTILENEIEAIINNLSYSDGVNKNVMVSKIAAFRTIMNGISLWNDSSKMNILNQIELVGNHFFGLGSVFKYTAIVGWTLLETRYDLLDIFRGYKVPLIKKKDEWITKISIKGNVVNNAGQITEEVLEGLTEVQIDVVAPKENPKEAYNKQDVVLSLDYATHCRLELLVASKDKLVNRAGNIIYANMKNSDNNFDFTEYFVGIDLNVGSDIRKFFNIETLSSTGSNGSFKINKINTKKSYD